MSATASPQRRRLRLLKRIVEGDTVAAAARKAGMSERHAYRVLADAKRRAEVNAR